MITAAEPGLGLDDVLTALEDREAAGSTGLGSGIAVPHARLMTARKFTLSIAVSRRGIEFASLDGKKARIFFTVVGPHDKPQDYLKLLAQISRVAKSRKARNEMQGSSSPLALRQAFLTNLPEPAARTARKGRFKLLTIILHNQRFLDDITKLFRERGVQGASVQKTTGLRSVLSHVPLSANFQNLIGDRWALSRTITTVVDEDEVSGLIEGLEGIIGDLNTHSGAMVFTTDLSFQKGSWEAP